MKFRFWGVRGSIPSPGPRTVRYGGNTTCIEVGTDDGTLIILDGGTGIFALAQDLIARGRPVDANIFISHSHWTTSTACRSSLPCSSRAAGYACTAPPIRSPAMASNT